MAGAQSRRSGPDVTTYELMAADYDLLSPSPDQHPMQHLRPALGEEVRSTRQLGLTRPGAVVEIAGLVVCRQRPATAKGIIFLLLEDEYGLANVLVSAEPTLSSACLDRLKVLPRGGAPPA